mgnify:CR=1 FL=1
MKIPPLNFNLFIVWEQVKPYEWVNANAGDHFRDVVSEFLQPAELCGRDNRQWVNAFAMWTFQPGTEVDLMAILKQVQEGGHATAIGLRKSDADTTVVALMRKKGKVTLHADRFLVHGIAAQTFAPKYGTDPIKTSKIVLAMVSRFHDFFDHGIADFVATPTEDWTSAMLLHVQRNLSLAQLEEQINDAKILYSSKKSENLANEYQCALVKTATFCINAKKEQKAVEMDEQTSLEQCRKNHAYVFEGSRAVLPNDCFQNTDNLVGTRIDEWTGATISVTWKEFMSNPDYFENYCAVILGSDATSGFGKSALAVRSALNMGKAMAMQRDLPASDGRCITRNSIEACRSLPDMRWPLVIDEFTPRDVSQAKHWSLDIAKIISNMTQSRDIRANYKNVDIPPHTPTIFTANAKSLEEWMGPEFMDCLPILRRFFVFILDPNPLKQNRMLIQRKLKEHMEAMRKGDGHGSAITKDCMLSIWGMPTESTVDAGGSQDEGSLIEGLGTYEFS